MGKAVIQNKKIEWQQRDKGMGMQMELANLVGDVKRGVKSEKIRQN